MCCRAQNKPKTFILFELLIAMSDKLNLEVELIKLNCLKRISVRSVW